MVSQRINIKIVCQCIKVIEKLNLTINHFYTFYYLEFALILKIGQILIILYPYTYIDNFSNFIKKNSTYPSCYVFQN